MKDRVIWKYRWDTLHQMMGDMVEHLQRQEDHLKAEANAENIMISRFDTLQTLVTCLQRFGQKQFDFFYNGFSEEPTDERPHVGYLKPSIDYPEEFVFRRTLDQIGYDLSLFQTIILQRETASEQKGGKKSPLYEALHTADRLAYQALKPAINAGLIEDATVLTYFQKSPSVRLIPYAPIALVAIPHSCIALPEMVASRENQAVRDASARDFLAIPHEVGHYVYRHGQFDGQTLSEALFDKLARQGREVNQWLEEIFSDVYGCLVAGPVMALDFMEMMMNHSPAEFISNDTDHPTPAIRPHAYFKILRDMKCKDQADALERRWEAMLKEHTRYVPDSVTALGEGVQDIAHEIHELPSFKTAKFHDIQWIGHKVPSTKLYDTFAEMVENERKQMDDITPEAKIITHKELDADGQPTLAQLEHPDDPTNVLRTWTMGDADGLSMMWVDELRRITLNQQGNSNGLPSRKHKIPPQVWKLVLSMNGWAIEGPSDGIGIPPWGN